MTVMFLQFWLLQQANTLPAKNKDAKFCAAQPKQNWAMGMCHVCSLIVGVPTTRQRFMAVVPIARPIFKYVLMNTHRALSSSVSTTVTTPLTCSYRLAHMNYGRLRAPLDDDTMREFRMAIGPINTLAQGTPGFYWSFDNDIPSERDDVELLRTDPLIMPQLSVWNNLESLKHFAFRSGHFMYYKRKKEWFCEIEGPYAVCWWWQQQQQQQQEGMIMPTLKEAFDRLKYLKDHGPSEIAFDFATAKNYPAPLSSLS